MVQAYGDLRHLLDRDDRHEMNDPATSIMIESLRAAYESLPIHHELAGIGADLKILERQSEDNQPTSVADLFVVVGQLVAALERADVDTQTTRPKRIY